MVVGVVLTKVLRVACSGSTVGSGVDPVFGFGVQHWKMAGVMVIQFGAGAEAPWDLRWDGPV